MSEYLTVKQASQRFPAFSEGSLRYIIFNAESNGFKRCLRKLGRKILINQDEFLNYINTNGGAV